MNRPHTNLRTERITIDPESRYGKPCIRDLRYPSEMILELLRASMTSVGGYLGCSLSHWG